MDDYEEKLEQAIINNDLFTEDQLEVIGKAVYTVRNSENKKSDKIWIDVLKTLFSESTGYFYEEDDEEEEME